MKRISSLIIFCLGVLKLYSQVNISPIKEYFDYLYRYNLNNLSYYNQSNLRLEPALPNELGNSVSWQMMQLTNLYEATHDKAYLVQLIHLSANSIMNRFDVINNLDPTYPSKWTLTTDNTNKESTYFNTILTIPMAKFIYLVRSNSTLYNTLLPFNTSTSNNLLIFNELIDLNSVYPSVSPSTISTYGDYADWLGARVEETMHYLDEHYWDANLGHVKWLGENNAAEFNFQSCFATLYFWMYKIDHTFGPMSLSHSYLHDKLVILKDLYFGDGGNVCITQNANSGSSFTILQPSLNGGYPCYEWGHYGSRNFGCNSFLNEDVSHGAMDLFFPMADYENGQEFFTNNYFFDRMHNTFTQKLWIDEFNFYNSVYANNNATAGTPLNVNATNCFYHEMLDWMPMYKIDDDNDPNNLVYDKLMQHTHNLRTGNFYDNATVYYNPTKSAMYHLGGQGALGLTEVIKAQWEKECVNLTLYNRDLVYDQDFNIKNRLTISPASNYVNIDNDVSYASFADPIIYTPTFTIEEGVTVNMVAGESIDFYPGTSVVAGGILSAKIQASNCTDGKSMSVASVNNNNGISPSIDEHKAQISISKNTTDSTTLKKETTQILKTSSSKEIIILPNPATDKINIMNADAGSIISLMDLSGNIVLKEQLNGNQWLDISFLSKGLYFVEIISNNSNKMQRLVKQ